MTTAVIEAYGVDVGLNLEKKKNAFHQDVLEQLFVNIKQNNA